MKEQNKEEDIIYINNPVMVENLVGGIKKGASIAFKFKFSEPIYFKQLLDDLEIDYNQFVEDTFYFDKHTQLHIAEKIDEYIWISNLGLIIIDKLTNNNYFNACINQGRVVLLLLKEAIRLSEDKNTYNINTFNNESLSSIYLALYHNQVFYIELFCKAYLSLNNIKVENTHKVSILYAKLKEIMYKHQHNDSLFHIKIVDKLNDIIKHISSMPNFKEQFVKYDDNKYDNTLIVFDSKYLNRFHELVERCEDFIYDLYYLGNESYDVKYKIYNSLLKKCESQEQRQKIADFYDYLINPDNQ